MNKPLAFVVLALVTGAALLLTRRAQAASMTYDQYGQPIFVEPQPISLPSIANWWDNITFPEFTVNAPAQTQPRTYETPYYEPQPVEEFADPFELWGAGGPWGTTPTNITTEPTVTAPTSPTQADANMRAFLAVIRRGESSQSDSAYRTVYGGKLWTAQDYANAGYADMAVHPYFAGWPGVKLPDQVCINAGFSPGCITTAAGAYQFISTTWERAARAVGAPDFAPQSQDAAAIYLIQERGAYNDVISGRFADALAKVASEWASLPGSTAKQGGISLATATQVYQQYGGAIA